jgi:PIN domain nuclease of toxin-antitoxin system
VSALVDTHALLWWTTDDGRLSRRARAAISAGDVLVSVVSLWEVEIKRGLGRIEIDLKELLDEVSRTEGFRILEVGASHIGALADLPPLHRDPFDRMLIAQAGAEHVPLVSRDRALRAYPIELIW